jgi:hypothetical protein
MGPEISYLALVDTGAISYPTDRDEWMLLPSEHLRAEATVTPLLTPKAPAAEPQYWSDALWPSRATQHQNASSPRTNAISSSE